MLEWCTEDVIGRWAYFDLWRVIDRNSLAAQAGRARLAALFKQPLAEAVAAGSCWPDLRVEELPLLINMLGAGLRGRTVKERLKLAWRAFEIVRFGLTP